MAAPDTKQSGRNRDAWWALLVVAALLVLAVIAFVTSQSELNDQATAAVLAASVTGAVTVFVAGFGLVNRRDERSERLTTREQDIKERADIRKEDAVFRAFEYFTGKTQRRNVGISILEHYWHETPHMRGMFVALLANQATYLLEESGQQDASHERSNLERIMVMLIRAADERIASPDDFALVIASIDRRSGPRERDAKGVEVSHGDLAKWKAGLAVPAPSPERRRRELLLEVIRAGTSDPNSIRLTAQFQMLRWSASTAEGGSERMAGPSFTEPVVRKQVRAEPGDSRSRGRAR